MGGDHLLESATQEISCRNAVSFTAVTTLQVDGGVLEPVSLDLSRTLDSV